MIQLIWALLNIGLIIFYLIICFKSSILIKQKLGALASIVFVFGFLSFIGRPNVDHISNTSGQSLKWEAKSPYNIENGNNFSKMIDLDKTLVSKYSQDIYFGREVGTLKYIPTNAWTSASGLVSGTRWKPIYINVEPTEPNTIKYAVTGTIQWHLLGITFYTQIKNWQGEVFIK